LKVLLILGTRPQIIKSAVLIQIAVEEPEINLEIAHTGQHYDFEMSKMFFHELDLPEPAFDLNTKSGSHAWQTGCMVIGLERAIKKIKPNMVLVPGDTNSVLAGALAAVKLHIPVAHIEAGARSFDLRMPEEINRKLTDHCSQILFAPTETCKSNLLREGIVEDKIFLFGDTMYDSMLKYLESADQSKVLEDLDLESENYGLLTVHRPENVDDREKIKEIIKATLNFDLTTVFPIHPRTRKSLKQLGLMKKLRNSRKLKLIKPVSYHKILKLIKEARLVLTDSGGVQKEAFWLRTPCLTLRDATEWVETVELGANKLVPVDKERIVKEAELLVSSENMKNKVSNLPNPFGDGKASRRILGILQNWDRRSPA